MLLYELESQYQEQLESAINTIVDGVTLEEFLDLGFNNATLLSPYEEDTDKKDINDLYKCVDGSYSIDLTEDMLKCRFLLSSTYEDGDGFTCCNIELENKEDWKYFEELVEEVK